MVYGDLSDQSGSEKKQVRMAGLQDRLRAFFFDLFIFTPIFSLLLSPLTRQLQEKFYSSPIHADIFFEAIFYVMLVLILTVIAQTLSLYFFAATPGKYFFKLRVESVFHHRLSFMQCLVRSVFWVFEFALFLIPFFEIMSHRHRRAMHDRIAETRVVTLKVDGDPGPHPLEARFFRNMMASFFVLFAFWTFLQIKDLYLSSKQEVEASVPTGGNTDERLCGEVSEKLTEGVQRLDLALARYMTKEIGEDCLKKEIDFVFWTKHKKQYDLAYVAQGYLSEYDHELQNKYWKQACEDTATTNEACQLVSRFISPKQSPLSVPANVRSVAQSNDETQLLPSALRTSLLSEEVLLIQELSKSAKYKDQLKALRQLSLYPGFTDYIQSETVKVFWSMEQKSEARGAYLNSILHLPTEQQRDLASWMCLQQVAVTCGNKSYPACDDLQGLFEGESAVSWSFSSGVALAQAATCRSDGGAVKEIFAQKGFRDLLDKYPPLRSWMQAISPQSPWTKEKKNAELKSLLQQNGVDSVLKEVVLQQLIRQSVSALELEQVYQLIPRSLQSQDQITRLRSQVSMRRQGLKNPTAVAQDRMPASLQEAPRGEP